MVNKQYLCGKYIKEYENEKKIKQFYPLKSSEHKEHDWNDVLLFTECSGVHRSLGVHYSKVRSLTLDDWEPEILKVMAELGNTVVNNVYEAVVIPPEITKATPKCKG